MDSNICILVAIVLERYNNSLIKDRIIQNGVEGLKLTEICTRNLTFACVLHQIALFRFWIDMYH